MLQSTRSRIVLLTALSALPALCIFLYSGWELRQQRVADARANMLLVAKGLAEIQHRHAESTRHLLEALALMDGVRSRDREACTRLFAKFMETHPEYTNILAATPEGDVFASGASLDSPINVSDRKHVRDSLVTKKFSAGEYIVSRATGDPAFPFSLPILDDEGNVTVILIAALKLSTYSSYLHEIGAPKRVIVGITDHAGIRLFYHPPASTNPLGKPISPPVWQAIQHASEDEGVALQVGSDGEERFFGWKRLRLREGEEPYINCVAGMPKKLVLGESEAFTRRNVGLWIVALLLGCGGAYLYGNAAMVRQLAAISRAAQALGQGDLAARTGLPHRNDDFGQLARTVDVMAEKIQSHDVERTRSEEALRLSEARFRKLLDEVDTVAVQGYTAQGNVLYWNKASELLYGYTAEEAMGRNLLDLIIPPPMRPEVREFIQRMATTDFIIPAGELYLQRKDGSLAPVFSSHVRLVVGDRVEMFCLDVDLSGLKQAEEAALKAKHAAEMANMAKTVFLANMSHEIRTPLNGVLGMLQLLELSPLSPDQRMYVEKAILSSKRLTRLLADILDLSQVESGRLALHPAPFKVLELQEAVLELFSTPAAQKGLSLAVTMDPSLPPALVGDEVRLRQILFNLVNNAIKFTDHGQVHVELSALSPTRHAAARMLISVCDSGPGIPPEKLPELFSPFTQLEPSHVRHDRGAGLGLAIVHRLATLMRGSIAVDSTPGEGTCIHVMIPLTLPSAQQAPLPMPAPTRQPDGAVETMPTKLAEMAAEHDASADPAPPPASPAPPAALRVLLAEDDDLNRLVAQRLLSLAGHTVVCAQDGEEALTLLREGSFDGVFMDIQMPVLDGLEATRRIRDGQAGDAVRHIPIIALTAHAMQGDRERFLAAGLDAYLEKPIAADKLLKSLDLFRQLS